VARTASVTPLDISTAFHELGLAGSPVCVHSSLSSFGSVDGGADAVVDAILDVGCTLMVPAHAWAAYSVRPAPDQWWERNGAHQAFLPAPRHNAASRYTTASKAIDKAMGAIPAAVVGRDGRARGDHPLMSFAAVGPDAAALIGTQRPDAVFAPVTELARRGGAFVLMGVGLERLTLLHYAEELAGRRPLVRWANGRDGRPAELDAGGCSAGFGRLAGPLRAHFRTRRVGASTWIAGDAATVIHAAVAVMRADPAVTHCRSACARCDDVIAGGPLRRAPLPR
jgi:aminoglycoside 3-N-acetyltransferase